MNLDVHFQNLMALMRVPGAELNLKLSKGHSCTQTQTSQLENKTEVPTQL